MVKRPALADATTLRQQMESGERNAEAIVREYLGRLEANQARLNAAVKMYRERALEEARRPRSGPLSGIPISIKETIGIKGEVITAGSQRMPPIYCREDATLVRRVRDAGAIIVARSNVPEFAMAGETENLLYGRSNNPLDESRTCGGSSGGEAALVASGSSAMGVGNDILGSVRIPAAFCGLVGFKPASQAVPKDNTWPQLGDRYTNSWLAQGPITRSVRDARLLYNVIAGAPLPERQSPEGLRLIIPRDFPMSLQSDCITAALVEAQTILEAEGLVTEEHAFTDVETHYRHLQKMVAHDFEELVYEMLTTPDGEELSLVQEAARQVIGRSSIYSGLFQLLAAAPLIRPQDEAEVERIVATYNAARQKYYNLLGDNGVLLLPTIGLLAPKHGRMNRASLRPGVVREVTMLTFPNYVNLPAIAIPAWTSADLETGLPPSVMLVCAPGAEAKLLDAAAVLDEAINVS